MARGGVRWREVVRGGERWCEVVRGRGRKANAGKHECKAKKTQHTVQTSKKIQTNTNIFKNNEQTNDT